MPPHASPTARAQALAFRAAKLTWREIGLRTGMTQHSLALLFRRAKLEPQTVPMTVPGRKPGTGTGNVKFTKRMKQSMKRAIERNPKLSARQLKAKLPSLRRVSVRMIQHVLCHQLGLPSRHAAKKPFLSDQMKAKRLAFAQEHANWSVRRWSSVMFSDESHFELFTGSRFTRVRRARGSNRFDPKFTSKTVKHPPKVMVWGCFSAKGRGTLDFLEPGVMMNQHRYLEILRRRAQPAMQRAGAKWFLQDGARPHVARSVKRWLAEKKWKVIDWPGNSPDLNPIENLWNWMKGQLADSHCANLDALKREISRLWRLRTPVELCRALAHSMPARMARVIEANGEMTKY